MVRLGGASWVALRRAWAAASSVTNPETPLSAPGAMSKKKDLLSNCREGAGTNGALFLMHCEDKRSLSFKPFHSSYFQQHKAVTDCDRKAWRNLGLTFILECSQSEWDPCRYRPETFHHFSHSIEHLHFNNETTFFHVSSGSEEDSLLFMAAYPRRCDDHTFPSLVALGCSVDGPSGGPNIEVTQWVTKNV